MAGINSFMYNQQVAQMPAQAQQSGLIWVNGEEGVNNYPVARGNTILLLDSQDSMFYLKSMDLTGLINVRKFKFEEVITPTATKDEPVNEISQLNNALESTNNIIQDMQKLMYKFQDETVEQMKAMGDKLNRLESKLEWKRKIKERDKSNE